MAIGVSYNGHTMSAANVAELQRGFDGWQARPRRNGADMIGRTFGGRAPMQKPQPPQPPTSWQGRQTEQYDPVDGPLVGITGNQSLEPDGQSRDAGTKGGFRLEMSRTEMEVRPSLELQCNEVVLVKLAYEVIFSESGRAVGRTPERKV